MKNHKSPWWLKWINYFIQVLFIRLTKNRVREINSYDIHSLSLTSQGLSLEGRVAKSTVYQWYSIQYWVIPFTGWNSLFEYRGSQKFLQITKKRIIA